MYIKRGNFAAIFDDVSGSNLFSTTLGIIYQILISSRHLGFSFTWCNFHQITDAWGGLRDPVSCWVLKSGIKPDHVKLVISELGAEFKDLNTEDLIKTYQAITGRNDVVANSEKYKYNDLDIVV